MSPVAVCLHLLLYGYRGHPERHSVPTRRAAELGSAAVTVSLTDDGGTADGGDDTSPDQTFTITVTTCGDVELTNVTTTEITDRDVSACERDIGTLAAGDSTTYTCTVTGLDTSFTNTVTATGYDPNNDPVDDEDTADVLLKCIEREMDPPGQCVDPSDGRGTAKLPNLAPHCADEARPHGPPPPPPSPLRRARQRRASREARAPRAQEAEPPSPRQTPPERASERRA